MANVENHTRFKRKKHIKIMDQRRPANWRENTEAFLTVGKKKKESGELQEAISCFQNAIASDNKSEKSYRELLEILISLKEYKNALEYCSHLKKNVSSHLASIFEGRIYFSQNEFPQGKCFQNVLPSDPNNTEAMYYLGLYCLFSKEYEKCKPQMSGVLKKEPNNAEAKRCLAFSELFLQNYNNAKIIYKQLIKSETGKFDLKLNYELALCYLKEEDYDALSDTCDLIYEIDKNFGYTYLLHSFLHFKKNDLNKIDEISDKLKDLSLEKHLYHKNLLFSIMAKVYLNPELREETISILENFKTRVNDNNYSKRYEEMESIIFFKSILLFQKMEREECVYKTVLERIKDELPFNFDELKNYKISNFAYFIGYLHLKLNNDDKSLKFFERAVQLDNTNPQYFIAQLNQLIHRIKYDEAKDIAFKCVEKYQQNKDISQIFYYYYACCLASVGNVNEAAKQLSLITPARLELTKMIEDFINHDLKFERQREKFYYQINRAYGKRKIEPYFCIGQIHDITKFKISDVRIECELNFGIYFHFRSVNYLLFQAHVEFIRKNYPEVIKLLSEAIDLDNYNFGIQCLLGLALLQNNQIKKANIYLKSVLDLRFLNLEYKKYYLKFAIEHILAHEEFTLSKFCLGLVSFHLKQHERAENFLLECVTTHRNNSEISEISYIYEILFRNFHKSFRFELLKQWVDNAKKELMNADGENSELDRIINIYEGILFFHKNEFDKSISCFDKIVKSHAMSSLVDFYNAVAIKRSRGHIDESIKHFEDLIKKSEVDSNACNFVNIEIHEYDQSISKNELLFNLAECYYKQDHREKFNETLKGIMIDAKQTQFFTFTIDDYYYYQGVIALRNEKYDISLQNLNKIKDATLNTNDSNPFIDRYNVEFYKAKCFYKLKQPEHAYELFRTKCDVDKIINFSKIDKTEFFEFKLNSLLDLIVLNHKKNDQRGLSFYLEEFKQFNIEIDERKNELEKSFLVQNMISTIIVEFEINKNFKKCLELSIEAKNSFENKLHFIYFTALSQFKLAMLSKEKSFDLLNESRNNFNEYVQRNNNTKQVATNRRLLNSYFILGFISQFEAQNENEIKKKNFEAIEYFKKIIDCQFNSSESNENEKDELNESMEFTDISLKFHYSISLHKVNRNKLSKEEFEKLKKELEENNNDEIIYYGVKLYIAIIEFKEIERKIKRHLKESSDDNLDSFRNEIEAVMGNLHGASLHFEYDTLRKFYLSKCYFYIKEYEKSFDLFDNSDYKSLGSIFENERNQIFAVILFQIGLRKYKLGIHIESKKLMEQSNNTCDDVIREMSSQIDTNRDLFGNYLLERTYKIKTYSYYYLDKFNEIKDFLEDNSKLLEFTDFIYYYSVALYKISGIKLVDDTNDGEHICQMKTIHVNEIVTSSQWQINNEKLLKEACENFSTYLMRVKKNCEDKNDVLSLTTENDDLQKYLTAKYFLACIMQSDSFFDNSIIYLIQILKHDDFVNAEISTKDIKISNIFKIESVDKLLEAAFDPKNSILNSLNVDRFKDYREFDINDVLYHLAQCILKLNLNKSNFEIAHLLLQSISKSNAKEKPNSFKDTDVLYLMGFCLFKMEKFNEALVSFDKCKLFTDKSIENHVNYLMGVCLTKFKTTENLKLAKNKFQLVRQNFNSDDELNKILIDTLCDLSNSYKKSNQNGNLDECYEETIKICKNVISRFDSSNEYYVHACERYYLSLYLRNKFADFRSEFKQNFVNNDLLNYLNTLVLFNILCENEKDEENRGGLNELLSDLKKECKRYLKSESTEKNKLKTAKIKYVHGYALLIDNQYEDALQTLLESNAYLNEYKKQFNQKLDLGEYLTESIDQVDIYFCILKAYFSLNDFEKVVEWTTTIKNENLSFYDKRLIDVNFMWAASNVALKKSNDKIEEELLKVTKNSDFYIQSKKILGKNYFHHENYENAIREISLIESEKSDIETKIIHILSLYRLGFRLHRKNQISRGKETFTELKEKLENLRTNDKNSVLTKIIYLSWTLFFLREFKDLEKHLISAREHFNKEASFFYDFDFLKGICSIENHKYEEFKRAENDFRVFLSKNELRMGIHASSSDKLEDQIYDYDIDDMIEKKYQACKYYTGVVNLYFKKYEDARKDFDVLKVNNVSEEYIREFFMFSINDLVASYVEVLHEVDANDKINDVKYNNSNEFIEKIINLNKASEFFDNNLQDCVIFYKAKAVYNSIFHKTINEENKENLNGNIKFNVADFENFSIASKFFYQTRVCLTNYYFRKKNFTEAEKCIKILENGNDKITETIKNEVTLLKAEILSEKLEKENLNPREKQELLDLTDEKNNLNKPANDLEKFIIMNFEAKLNGNKDENNLEKLEGEINDKAKMHESNIEFIYLQGKIAFLRQNHEKCLKHFTDYISKCGKSGRIKARRSKIKSFEIGNHYDSLITECSLLRNDLDSTQVHAIDYDISKAYFKQNNYKKCLEYLEPKYTKLTVYFEDKDRSFVNQINYMIGICVINEQINNSNKVPGNSDTSKKLNNVDHQKSQSNDDVSSSSKNINENSQINKGNSDTSIKLNNVDHQKSESNDDVSSSSKNINENSQINKGNSDTSIKLNNVDHQKSQSNDDVSSSSKNINENSQINKTLEFFSKIRSSDFEHSDIVNFCIRSLYYINGHYKSCLEINPVDNLPLKVQNLVYTYASNFWISCNDNQKLKDLVDQIERSKDINDNPFISFYKAIIHFEINELDRFLIKSNNKVETFIQQVKSKLKNIKNVSNNFPSEYCVIDCLKYENLDEINFVNAFVDLIEKNFEQSLRNFANYENCGSMGTNIPIKQYLKLIAFNGLIEKEKMNALSITRLNQSIEDAIQTYYKTRTNLEDNLQNVANYYPKKLKHYYIGSIYFHLNDFTRAQDNLDKFLHWIKEYQSNLTLRSEHYDIEPIRLKISICYFECERYETSLRLLEEINSKMLKEYIFYHKARNYLKLGESKIKSNQEFRVELKNALNNINEAIDIGKKNSFKNLMFSYFYKGVILYKDNKYIEALKAFDEQIKLQDDFGNSYVYKAYCYENAPELKDKMSQREILNLYNKGLINSEGYDWLEKRVKCFKLCQNSDSQIFISYAHEDKQVVHAFTNFFKQCGFNCWIDYEKTQIGDMLKETLKDAISNSKIFISFLSPAYGKSTACQYEVEIAQKTAKELKLHILPIIVNRPSKLDQDNKFKWLMAANGFDMNKILQIDQQVIYANLVGINASPSEIIKHRKIGELLNVISDKLLNENSKLI